MPNVSLIQNMVGGWNESDTRLANLSDSVNLFPETQGQGASSTSMLRSISGTSLLLDISDRPCRGMFECARGIDGFPVLFAVFANKLYVIRDVDGSLQAEEIYSSLTNLDTPVSMCETGGEGSAHPHLIVVDGANVISCNTELNTEDMRNPDKDGCRTIALPYRVRQEDAERPSQRIVPTHCAYMYNYLIVNDEGTDAFYITYQYPFEREGKNHDPIDYDIFMIDPWKPGEEGYRDYGFITYSEWSPDNTTALCSNATLLYTFGPKSTQIFNYNSDVDAPFVSPTNAANSIGIKAVHSLAMVGDYVFFLGSSAIGENGIYYWQANQLNRCSTPDVERKISQMINPADAKGQCWAENGHLFYAITFIKDDYTLVYDILEGAWHRRSSKDKYTNAHHYWRPQFATLHKGKLMFGTGDGKLVYLNPKKFDEYDGRPMIRMRRSGMLMNNYQQFFIDGIKLICNKGDFDDPELNPQIMMRYSDDGGDWSNQEIGLLGRQGRYDWEVEWMNLGLHEVVSVEVSVSDPVAFNIISGKIQYTLCDSF